MPNAPLPYQFLAKYYDKIGGDRFSTLMVEYTFRLLKRARVKPKTALDLCCGTGTAACLFSKKKIQTTGLDRSPEMLKVARAKARKQNLKIDFVRQDLTSFKIFEKGGHALKTFDLITCFFDSLNYLLTEDDLLKCFNTVQEHLNPDGLFIFDMNTTYMLKYIWPKGLNSGCRDNYAWVWPAWYDEKTRTADLDAFFFIKEGKIWQRYQEHHTERAYSNNVIKKLLKRSGLETKYLYHCLRFRRPTSKSRRVAVVAQKI